MRFEQDLEATNHEFSSLDSLPLAQAFPERTHSDPTTVFATAVDCEFIKEPKRCEQDRNTDTGQKEQKRPSLIGFRFQRESLDQPL